MLWHHPRRQDRQRPLGRRRGPLLHLRHRPRPSPRSASSSAVRRVIGIAGAPIAGRLADRCPSPASSSPLQLLRAAAGLALLTTDHYAAAVVFAAVGGLGDRAANVLTKLYAARIAGPDRIRYQAINRTISNTGWALGGLAAAAALAVGTTTAYQSLLIGDALSSVPPPSHPPLRRTPRPSRDRHGIRRRPRRKPANPWRDRTYLAYVASEAVLFLDARSSRSACRSGSSTPPTPRSASPRC